MHDRVHRKFFPRRARILGRLGFLGVFALAVAACNGVPGDGPGFASQEQPKASASAPDATAAATKVAEKYVSTTTPGDAGYLIGPQDVLEVSVYKAPDLSKTVPVSEDGTINLPLIGPTLAAGKSAAQLERDIQKRLDAGYLRSPQVTVVISQYNSQRVTVEGAVRSQGVLPLHGSETLGQIIARAGGPDRSLASDDIIVFRTAGGSKSMIRYNLGEIRSGAADDPQVQPGDVIVLEDSTAKQGLQLVKNLLPIAGFAMPFM